MSNQSTDSHGKSKYADLLNTKLVDGYIITIMNDFYSSASARTCIQSIATTESWINPLLFAATTPQTIVVDINKYLYEWKDGLLDSLGNPRYTWPINEFGDRMDFATGVHKKHYTAKDVRKVVAAAISHMRLWASCYYNNKPIVILEHDVVFTRRFKTSLLSHVKDTKVLDISHTGMWLNGICSLNDPRGATRRGLYYHDQMKTASGCRPVVKVNNPNDPEYAEGLPGNSAYIITPEAAKMLLDKSAQIGIWPNDALMCRQLFPFIQSYYPYFTQVNQQRSTTTG